MSLSIWSAVWSRESTSPATEPPWSVDSFRDFIFEAASKNQVKPLDVSLGLITAGAFGTPPCSFASRILRQEVDHHVIFPTSKWHHLNILFQTRTSVLKVNISESVSIVT